jgi:hypothetical protein
MRSEEHVRRLEVAVHDPANVQCRERGKDSKPDRHRLGHAHRPAMERIAQRLTFEQLHRDE